MFNSSFCYDFISTGKGQRQSQGAIQKYANFFSVQSNPKEVAVHRRWLPSVPMSKVQRGAYATEWEGWTKAWKRDIHSEKVWKWNPKPIEVLWEQDFLKQVPGYFGVYVFLTHNNYVLYLGRGTQLGKRIRSSYKNDKKFPGYMKDHIRKFAAHRALNEALMKYMEFDLLRYYTPPWNTKFSK